MKWIGYQFLSTCSIGTHSWGLSKFVARKAYLTTRLWNIFINVQLYMFNDTCSIGTHPWGLSLWLEKLTLPLCYGVFLLMFNCICLIETFIFIYIYIYMYLFFAFLLDNVWLLLLRTYSHKEINNSRNY